MRAAAADMTAQIPAAAEHCRHDMQNAHCPESVISRKASGHQAVSAHLLRGLQDLLVHRRCVLHLDRAPYTAKVHRLIRLPESGKALLNFSLSLCVSPACGARSQNIKALPGTEKAVIIFTDRQIYLVRTVRPRTAINLRTPNAACTLGGWCVTASHRSHTNQSHMDAHEQRLANALKASDCCCTGGFCATRSAPRRGLACNIITPLPEDFVSIRSTCKGQLRLPLSAAIGYKPKHHNLLWSVAKCLQTEALSVDLANVKFSLVHARQLLELLDGIAAQPCVPHQATAGAG